MLTRAFKRSPNVIVNVLQQAEGRCEGCGQSTLFQRADGAPILTCTIARIWQTEAKIPERTRLPRVRIVITSSYGNNHASDVIKRVRTAAH